MWLNLPSAFETVDAQEINTKLHRRLSMSDGGALVEDDDASLLELADDGTGRVASSLHDLDTLINDNLGVSLVVGGNKGRQKSDVDGEWPRRQLLALANFLTETLRFRPDQGSDDTQATSIGYSTGQLGCSYMLLTR